MKHGVMWYSRFPPSLIFHVHFNTRVPEVKTAKYNKTKQNEIKPKTAIACRPV